MFSGLVNMLTAKPRYAENADARQEIKRHDPEQERRKKDQQNEEEKIRFDTYDNAVVSVDSLRIFLQNFLQSMLEKITPVNAAQISPSIEKSNDSAFAAAQLISAETSRAVNVYKTAAKTARPSVQEMHQESQKLPLDNDEIRMIYKLLNETAVLQARGVEFLAIERDETFLKSLDAAVQKALRS